MKIIATLIAATLAIIFPTSTNAAEHVVYSVYKGLDFGNPDEVPQKDFYVNIGTSNGVRSGSILKVIRKVPTYDVTSQKLYKDLSFPIATLKVIHVENNAAVARLDKIVDPLESPAVTPRAVMVGDQVQVAN